jgi:putative hydrolase of the HAD superfamily
MKKIFNQNNYSYWIFDLDNTLYPEDDNIFSQVKMKIVKFISLELNLDLKNADAERQRLYNLYGTSLRGLMTEYKIIPNKFLDYVHDIDLSDIIKNLDLNIALQKLKGEKYIFTNGSFKHAENVLNQLGIKDNFKSIHSIETCNYIPKPSQEAYETVIKREKILTDKSIMFEDTSWNLKTAKKLGMTTVLVTSKNHLLENNKNDYIDYHTTDLVEFLN